MFLVFDKQKICAYIVSVLTVALLFCTVSTFQLDKASSIPTSTNQIKENNIENNENLPIF